MVEEKSHVGMARCFFCLKQDKILLDKRLRKSLPRDCGVIDMEPCAECEGYMKQGILLISVLDGSLAQTKDEWERGDIPNPYRTGGWCVVKQEAVERMVTPPELLNAILKRRWSFIEDSAWNAWGLPRNV